ncbi:hypothetical protein BDR04DRAFT_1088024 [Suillus decipiens]|nr:hypothetical protein BDR04DRAFT_1088024 [Suillus decipiens]
MSIVLSLENSRHRSTTVHISTDSDSSDSDYITSTTPVMSASKNARVKQSSASNPPFLTVGEITPEALLSWEMACMQFFIHKDVPEDERVKKVARGMQDPRIQNWYLTNKEEIDALSFREYMIEIRSTWLPLGWEGILRRKMLSSTQGQCPFQQWAIDVQRQNILLRGTPSHLADINILFHLESRMNVDLAADYDAGNIAKDDLHKWIKSVCILEKKHLRYLARQKEAVEAALRAERARLTSNRKSNTNTRFNAKGNNSQSKNTSSKPFTRLPALTKNEHQLLRDNDGCFKCREPFVGHTSSNCQKGSPDGAFYKMLTASTVLAKKTKRKEGVSAVDIEEENEVIAVAMSSAVLGNGTDSGEECVAPLQTPHLH